MSIDHPQSNLPEKLGAPARRALDQAGIWRLEQLAAYTEDEIKRLHGIGPNAVLQLRAALAAAGLTFAGEQDPPG